MDARRAEMCRAAAQIFRDRGFDATSVSDIARALGLTKAGLYHYFDSKEALLFEIMSFGLDRVRDEVAVPVRAIRDPEDRLRQLIVRHARITTRGQGAVAHLGDEIRALPPASRKQLEERMRVYFDLIRDTLAELKTLRARERIPDIRPGNTRFNDQFEIPTFDEILRMLRALDAQRAAATAAAAAVSRRASAAHRGRAPQKRSLKANATSCSLGVSDKLPIRSFKPLTSTARNSFRVSVRNRKSYPQPRRVVFSTS